MDEVVNRARGGMLRRELNDSPMRSRIFVDIRSTAATIPAELSACSPTDTNSSPDSAPTSRAEMRKPSPSDRMSPVR